MTAPETFTTASKRPLTTGRRPDMTAPETFTTASKRPLTTGRRPDTTAICAEQTAGVDVKETFEDHDDGRRRLREGCGWHDAKICSHSSTHLLRNWSFG